MTWAKLDDAILDNPKILEVGPLGLALYVAGLAHAARNLTDGFIPEARARTLLDWHGIATSRGMLGSDVTGTGVATMLVEAGLWEEAEGGYQIHDFLKYNPSRSSVEAEREASRVRQQRFYDAQRRKPNADPNAVRISKPNGVMIARLTGAPDPDPVPTDPDALRAREASDRPIGREPAQAPVEPMSLGGRAILTELRKHTVLAPVATVAMADALSAPLVVGKVRVEWIAATIAECAAKLAARVAAGDTFTASQLGEKLAAFASKARAPDTPRTNGAPKNRAAMQPVPPDTEEFAWQHRR